MKVKREGGHLIIAIPEQTLTPSSTGKSMILATTGGNKATDIMINGKPLIIGLTAYVKN